MDNQDIEGKSPADAAPAAPAGTPETVEQQLARERDARTLMRDRLRHTEALAAESHALRARMAQELERVTAERDRLRSAAATGYAAPTAAPTAAAGASASAAAGSATSSKSPTMTGSPAGRPPMTPRPVDWPLRPPEPPRRSGPWLALGLLTGLAVGVAGLAWITGAMPGENRDVSVSAPARIAAGAPSTPVVADAAAATAPAASPVAGLPLPNGAVALAPLTPESVLAAVPTAAGRAAAPALPALPAWPARLRSALDAEGIVAPVDIDAANGHVDVSDPAADTALRDRTDMIIRAVYAGASLPEPQIEHRWLSPPRAGRVASPALPVAETAAPVAFAKAPAREPVGRSVDHPRHLELFADAPESRPILPAGRVTAACKDGVSARSSTHRAAEFSACMKHSCCSSTNRQTEECRAYDKAYPFTCGAG